MFLIHHRTPAALRRSLVLVSTLLGAAIAPAQLSTAAAQPPLLLAAADSLPAVAADPLTAAATPLPDAPAPASELIAPLGSSSSAQAPQTPAKQDPGKPATGNQPAQNDQAATPGGAHQTKRIGGIMPNYRSVSADQQVPRQNAKQKFIAAGRDSFDYGSFVLAAIQAGFSIEGNSYPEFHKGVPGYLRYYWRTQLDTTDENFLVGGVLPSLLRQDNRFYTLGHGSFAHRALYASTRILITRGDSGNAQFNFSEIIGSGAAAGISSTYYPAVYRTWTKVGQKWLTGVLIDSANTTFKEFWPDINKHVFRNRD